MRKLVCFYGLLDVALLAWIIGAGVLAQKVPILDDLLESLELASSFGAPFSAVLATAPYILLLSLAASGPLLLLNRRSGVILSLLQSPFRLLGIIQPSLFFVVILAGSGLVYWVQLGLALAFEIFKAVSLVIWLRTHQAQRNGGRLDIPEGHGR